MNKEKKDNQFIKKPIYPGGNKAYSEFIKKNLKYPEKALKNKTEGTVLMKYEIDHKGNVTDVKVIKSVPDGCDEEAVRVIKKLKFDIPKGPRKLKVKFHKEAKIHFRLPKTKTKKTKTSSLKYVVTTTKKEKKNQQENKKENGSYSYTIKW